MAAGVQREGFVSVPGGRLWYEIVGNSPGVPLLTLHGGPGFPHDYLTPLTALADDRPVIFYDQLGCGKSDRPDDTSLWTVERAVAELAAVRAALGLERLHLLGHSWGTMLAVAYLLAAPEGVVSLTLASPALSAPQWAADARRLVAALPDDVRAVIARHEADGTTDDPAYEAATQVYMARHGSRLDPVPDEIMRAVRGQGTPVYQTMWGPSEFSATGNLRTFDCTARLHELRIPTLVTCGRYDEATPETVAAHARLIPGAQLVVFEQSAHMAHLEEPALFLHILRDFLRDAV